MNTNKASEKFACGGVVVVSCLPVCNTKYILSRCLLMHNFDKRVAAWGKPCTR